MAYFATFEYLFDILDLLAELINRGFEAEAETVRARSVDLEHRVLTSRLNSWDRNSSFRRRAGP